MSDEHPKPLPAPQGEYEDGFLDGVRATCALAEAGARPAEILAALPGSEPVDLDAYSEWLRQLRTIMALDHPHFTGREEGGAIA